MNKDSACSKKAILTNPRTDFALHRKMQETSSEDKLLLRFIFVKSSILSKRWARFADCGLRQMKETLDVVSELLNFI